MSKRARRVYKAVSRLNPEDTVYHSLRVFDVPDLSVDYALGKRVFPKIRNTPLFAFKDEGSLNKVLDNIDYFLHYTCAGPIGVGVLGAPRTYEDVVVLECMGTPFDKPHAMGEISCRHRMIEAIHKCLRRIADGLPGRYPIVDPTWALCTSIVPVREVYLFESTSSIWPSWPRYGGMFNPLFDQ
jgi:hypothetical protein